MGQLIIPPSSKVYLDTSVIIYTIEFNPDYWQLFQPFWENSQAEEFEIFSSELTLIETLVVPLRNANNFLVDAYEQFLRSQICLLPISQTILKEAARLRAITNLKTPDAIHAATALDANCTPFLTTMLDFVMFQTYLPLC